MPYNIFLLSCIKVSPTVNVYLYVFSCVLFLIGIFYRFTGVYKHWQDIAAGPPGGGLASHLHSRGRSGKYKNILRETEACVNFGFFAVSHRPGLQDIISLRHRERAGAAAVSF